MQWLPFAVIWPLFLPMPTPHELIELGTIRHRESGDSYTAENKHSSATGGEQIIKSTWQRWCRVLNVSVVFFPTALSAPPVLQDAVALYGLRTEGERPWKASKHRRR